MTSSRDNQSPDTVDLEICCPVETRILSILRAFSIAMADEVGFNEEGAAQVEMAVDEACTNVIRHAYKHLGISPDLPEEKRNRDDDARRSCVLKLRALLGRDYLKFSIIDHGIGLNRMPCGVQSVEEFQEKGGQGGLGIYIIHNFMDEVEYDFPPESGTILTMTKFLHSQHAAK